jgi:tetratricopeptide (TPR) repeat protein
VGDADGVAYFIMDLVDGPNLAERARHQPFLPREAAVILETMARAVAYAHAEGILHRDLKPSNVLLDLFGQPQITDFGLAKHLDSDSSVDTRHSSLTLTGQSLGSPGYAAPEQVRAATATVTSDVYGLGATLYHLLTGRPPFVGATAVETLHAAQESDPVSPRALNPAVPRDLETICLKCLEKEASKRYATAQDLAEDLDRFLNDEPIVARSITRVERAHRWCRRKPALAATSLLLLLLILIVIIGSPIAAYRINEARRQAAEEAAIADAINEFLTEDLLRQADVWKAEAHASPNRDVRLLEIVDRASGNVDAKFAGQPLVAAKIHLTVGSVYAGLGETEKAENHLRTAKTLFETHAGPDDPRTLEVNHALAVLLRVNRAAYQEAEALIRHVLDVRQRMLGPDHPDTLTAMLELAHVRNERQAHDEAENLFTEVEQQAITALGVSAPLALDAREGVIGTLRDRGEWQAAKVLKQDLLEMRTRVQGLAHPSTLETLADLVSMMRALQEDFPTAAELIEQGLALSRPIFAEHGPTATLNSQKAVLLNHQGRCEESLALRHLLWTNAVLAAGPNHPQTLIAYQYVGYHHAWYGNDRTAIDIFEESLRKRRTDARRFYHGLGPNLDWLARLYWRLGRRDEAIALRQELVAISRKIYGLSAQRTRGDTRELAGLHARIGQWRPVAELLTELAQCPQPAIQDIVAAGVAQALAGNIGQAVELIRSRSSQSPREEDPSAIVRYHCAVTLLDALASASMKSDARVPTTSRLPEPPSTLEPNAFIEGAAPIPAALVAAIAEMRDQAWHQAADRLTPLALASASLHDRVLTGFLLAWVLSANGATAEAKERLAEASQGLGQLVASGDLGDRWMDTALCALAAQSAVRASGAQPLPRVEADRLLAARERWQPIHEAFERVWMLARHCQWSKASEALLRVQSKAGFDWATAEASIIRWPLKLAVIHAKAGNTIAYEAVCRRQVWDPNILPPFVHPITLLPDAESVHPVAPLLLDAREMAFTAEHGVERYVPEWEPLAVGISLLQSGQIDRAVTQLAEAQNAFNLHCRCVALAYGVQAEIRRGQPRAAAALLADAEAILAQLRANQPGDLGRLWFEMGFSELAIEQAQRWLLASTSEPTHGPLHSTP